MPLYLKAFLVRCQQRRCQLKPIIYSPTLHLISATARFVEPYTVGRRCLIRSTLKGTHPCKARDGLEEKRELHCVGW